MAEAILIVVSLVNLVLLIWFIFTLNAIKEFTRRTAEDASRLAQIAERFASPKNPVEGRKPVEEFNDGMTPAELVAAIESLGGRLKLLDDAYGLEVVLENPLTVGSEGTRLVKLKNRELVAYLEKRKNRQPK